MAPPEKRVFGRYTLNDPIASGGMATVYFGRHVGPAGFARTVAIKRLHPHLASDPEFVTGMLDEARLAARIHHPNVVQTIDVVAIEGELLLVMDYVQGESLSHVLSACSKRKIRPPADVVSAILINVLHGLHAAHEARSEIGEALDIVHRDVSPQNVLVGADGVSRVLDFGVAKAANRLQTTQDGAVKGKVGYMSPEQAMGKMLDRRSDIFSAGIVLFEALTAKRLFAGDDPGSTIFKILHDPLPDLPEDIATPELLKIVTRALAKTADDRYPTAHELAVDLESAIPPATPREVGEWLKSIVGATLAQRAEQVAEFERNSADERPVEQPIGPPTPPVLQAAPPASPPSDPRLLAAASAPGIAVAPPAPPERRVPIGLVAAIAVAAAVAIGGASYGLGVARTKSTTATAAGAPSAATSTTSDDSNDPDPVITMPVVPLAPGTPTPSASASTTSRPRVTKATPPAKPPATGRAKPGDCQDPFVTDENGIKHVKPGCIR